MRLRCPQRELARAVSAASRILPPRGAFVPPVLLIEAGEVVFVRAAAPDIQVRLQVEADVEAPGRAAVMAHMFVDLITLLDERELVLSDDSGQLRVEGFQVDSSFQVLDAARVPAEFPVAPGHWSLVSSYDLFKACSRVEIAIAGEDTVPILTGTLAQFGDEELALVATDGRRLTIDRVELTKSKGDSAQLVLPGKLVRELHRILESEDGLVRSMVDPSGQRIVLETATVSVRALGLDGTYPNYAARMPKTVVTRCLVATELLVRRLQAAAMFASDEIPSIEVQLKPGYGLVVSAASSDRGATVAEVATDVTGGAASLALNPRFLLDGLRVVSSDKVELQVTKDPAVLLLRTDPADGFIHLVVPRTRASE